MMPMSPEEKRPYVQRLFSRIAPRYDWFNRLVSCGLDQGWRRTVVARAQAAPGQTILDVCTGTGDLALLCAARGARVIGLDMNWEMLARAPRKSKAKRLSVAWVRGDAESLPLANGSVDRVLIGFSTRNLSDLTRGLSEMVRVLRFGGQLLILETGYPSNPVVRFGYQLFLFTIARLIGLLLTGRVWPFTYLARSVKQFLTPAQMVERLQQLQTQVEYVPLSYGLASLYIATKLNPSITDDCAADVRRRMLEMTCP